MRHTRGCHRHSWGTKDTPEPDTAPKAALKEGNIDWNGHSTLTLGFHLRFDIFQLFCFSSSSTFTGPS